MENFDGEGYVTSLRDHRHDDGRIHGGTATTVAGADMVSEHLDKMQHLDPSSAAAKTSKRNRQKVESMLRNDSLSSDPSDCPRPPPPKPHKHRKGKKQRQRSLSSSDDEIRSTPDCSSCEEPEIESESVSEKGETFFWSLLPNICIIIMILRSINRVMHISNCGKTDCPFCVTRSCLHI